MANSSFSICAYLDSVPDRAHDAYEIDCRFCNNVAPRPSWEVSH